MSWINIGAVYYMLVRKSGKRSAQKFMTLLPELPLALLMPDVSSIMAAAKLKSTRRLSYADAFAANLAIDLGATLVTGDPELAQMTDKFDVEWLGSPTP